MTRCIRIGALLCLLFGMAGIVGAPVHSALADTTAVSDCSGEYGSGGTSASPTSGSLQTAVNNAAAGDTITFSCGGTIAMSSTLTISKDVTIDGSGQSIVLDGAHSVQLFVVNSGVTLNLTHLTLSNGHDPASNVNGGIDSNGGAVHNNGTLTVTNSTLTADASYFNGGAIYNAAGATLAVSGSTFDSNPKTGGNDANGHGGGVYNATGGTATIATSTFSGNDATGDGGAIWNGGTLSVINSTLGDTVGTVNEAGDSGGAIFNDQGGQLTVSNSFFGGNQAAGGGALNNYGNASITNSTFSQNTAVTGGAILNDQALTISNSTITGNGADNPGAGIGILGGTLTLGGTIIADNMCSDLQSNCSLAGPEINCAKLSGSANVIDAGYNMEPGGACLSSATGDTEADPGFVGLYATDNGGPTPTMALTGTSPAIDQIPSGNSLCPATDQRGFDRPAGAGCDIGAFEYHASQPLVCPSFSSLQSAVTDAYSPVVVLTCDHPDVITFSSTLTIGTSTALEDITFDASTSPAPITFDGGGSVQLFTVQGGIAVGGSHLGLKALTLSHGKAGSATSPGYGGAISNDGTVTISNSTLSYNSATGSGGAISNDGTLTISNSTLFSNSATVNGGAIRSPGTTTIINSTLVGNSATTGGAIKTGGQTGANVTMAGTIIAGSSGGNCSGTSASLTDNGYNLEWTGSTDTSTGYTCGFSSAKHDIVGSDPLLGALASNGGPTQTVALQSGSPAIDQIPTGTPPGLCPANGGYDQRGLPRPDSGSTCDIGAYEYQSSPGVPPSDTTPPTVSVSTSPAAVPSGQAGYFNAADLAGNSGAVTVNVSATDTSGVTNLSCTDAMNGGNAASATVGGQTGNSPRTGSFSVSADGTHAINCTATDGAGNTGAAAGSSNATTVMVDGTPPSSTIACNLLPCSGPYASPVSVTLSASDNVNGSGVREIVYTTDGSAPTASNGSVYSNAFTVTSSTPVKYAAIDNAGNVETTNTQAIAITNPDALAVNSASGTYGGTTKLSATLTSGGAGVSGKTVTFSLNGTAVCGGSGQPACPTTDSNGTAALSNVSLSGIDAGTYPSSGSCGNTTSGGISASFAGDGSNSSSSGCATLTVSQATQATLTLTAPPSGTYGQSYPLSSSGGSGTGAVTYSVGNSTACSISGSTLTITGGTGTCVVTANRAADTNYAGTTSDPATVTVSRAPLTITPTHDPISFGDPAPTGGWGYTASGFVGGDTAGNTTISGSPSGCSTSYVQGNPPGSAYAITCSDTSGMSASNYTFTLATGTLTVGSRAITVTATDAGYTYGNTPPTSFGGTVTAGSLAGTDTVSGLGVTCSPVDNTSTPFTPGTTTAAGTYAIVCSGGSSANYRFSYLPGTLTVSPRPITVTANSPASQTYGVTSAPAISCTSSDFLNGDTFQSTPSGSVYDASGMTPVSIGTSSNAGSYTTECSGGSVGGNYTIQAYQSGTFTISPAALSITASDGTMTYGGTLPTITPQYSGFVNGDTPGSLTTAPTCSTLATTGSGVGQYASSCAGAVDGNYRISYAAGHVTVKPAALAVTAPSPSMTYGDTTLPSLARATVTGLKNSDTFSGLGGTCALLTQGNPPATVTLSSRTPAGTYTVHCSGVSSANYAVSYTDGLLTVSPAPLTITASGASMTYAGTVPTITPQYSAFAGTDTAASLTTAPTCSTAATNTSGVGQYASTCSGAVDGNYTITYVSGAVQVTPAVLTVAAPSASVQYSDPVPSLIPSISGYLLGQGSSTLTTLPTCTSAVATAPFANAAGTTTTAGVASPVGTYAVTCSGGSAANYTFAYTAGTLTVTPEDATVQMGASTGSQILGTGPITLTATVRDSAASGYAGANAESSASGTVGDVTKTFVEFDIYTAAACLSGTPLMSPVVSVTSGTPGVGTATYSLASPVTETSYCVVPRIVAGPATAGSGYGINGANSYYTALPGSVTDVAFYQNTGQFVVGGGWIADSSSTTGQGALSVNARYTRAGGAKGQVTYVWRAMYNGQFANFTITSNAINTLIFSGSGTAISATLQGKCAESIVSVATRQVLFSQGNLAFTATAKDGDYGLSQRSASDAFSLSVFTSGNSAIKQVTAAPLGGGNLVIHNG